MDRNAIATQLGALYRDLPSSSARKTGIHEPPPMGAARLLRRERNSFVWQPLTKRVWANLSDRERGEILLNRGEAWLDANARIKSSPLAYVSSRAAEATSRRLFGKQVATLKEAILYTYRLMHRNPVKAKGAILSLEVTVLVITGVHPLALVPPAIDLLIEAYGTYLSSAAP